jgi:nucleotide-binding universal stress UspA family protein
LRIHLPHQKLISFYFQEVRSPTAIFVNWHTSCLSIGKKRLEEKITINRFYHLRCNEKEGNEMAKQTKKLLLAVDGSDRALDAVNYVSRFAPFHKTKAVLFNVFGGVPESYWDLEKNPQFSSAAREVRAWEMEQRKVIHEFMEKAKQLMIRSGFPENQITIKVQNRKKGIARDIIHEAANGYNAVIIGRKGFGSFKETIVGSVANKIVEKASFLPVLLIGPIPPDENILIAIDGSENTMRAIDYIADTLGGFDFKIHLLHVIRGMTKLHPGSPHLFLPKEAAEQLEKEINAVFEKAKQRLTEAGFQENQIETKIISGAESRAGAIIQEAREHEYGTIVVGRRGLSKVQEFFMGRVSNKVIHTVRNRAVWVVT